MSLDVRLLKLEMKTLPQKYNFDRMTLHEILFPERCFDSTKTLAFRNYLTSMSIPEGLERAREIEKTTGSAPVWRLFFEHAQKTGRKVVDEVLTQDKEQDL